MQQVNFYQEEFHTRYNWKQTAIFASVAVLVLMLAGINASQIYSTNQLSTELENKRNTLKSLEQNYVQLEKSAKPKAQDMNLVAELERMKRNNTEKLRALNYLSGNDSGNMTGFSFLMQGLGRKRDTIDDLWLKKIQFSRGGYDMRLSGSSYQPELLPKFIQALSNEEIFKDREFKEVKITRSTENKKIMDFVLDTQFLQEEGSDTNNESVALFMARLKQMAGVKEIMQ